MVFVVILQASHIKIGADHSAFITKMFKNLADPYYVLKFQNLCGLRRENSSGTLTEWTPTKEGGGKGLSSKSIDSESTSFRRPRKGNDNKGNFSTTNVIEESPKSASEGEVLYNRYIHSLYFFGSGLGDEVFYLTVFPFLFWNWDEYVMRRLVLLWVFSMYIGQGLKDVLRWPRPPSPPVIVMETKYESEYGMPSTHAIVGSIVPFSLVYFSYGRYEVCDKFFTPFSVLYKNIRA